MLIEVSTDGTIQDDKNFSAEVKVVVCAELDRYSNGISRVDVYLSGANGQTAGYGDKCCLIKARRDGRERTHPEKTPVRSFRRKTVALDQAARATL